MPSLQCSTSCQAEQNCSRSVFSQQPLCTRSCFALGCNVLVGQAVQRIGYQGHSVAARIFEFVFVNSRVKRTTISSKQQHKLKKRLNVGLFRSLVSCLQRCINARVVTPKDLFLACLHMCTPPRSFTTPRSFTVQLPSYCMRVIDKRHGGKKNLTA